MALQTATNPETGEKVALVGDQWLPISQTATNDKGQKAYLVNNQWLVEPTAAPKPAPERSWSEVPTDIAAKAVSGLGGLAQFPGQLYGLATGAIKDKDFATTGLYGLGQEMQDWAKKQMSEGLKAKEAATEEKVKEAERTSGQGAAFLTGLKETITDPAQLTAFLAEQVPQSIPSLIAALIPGVGPAAAAEIRAAQLAAKGATSQVAKAAAEKTLEEAIKRGTQESIERGAKAAVQTAAVQQGADIGSGTYDAMYKYLTETKGMSPEQAADETLNYARAAGVGGGLLSLLAQRLPGAQALERAMAGERLGTGAALDRAKMVGLGILKETPGENVEEVGGRFLQNLAMQQVNPQQSLTEGLGQTAAQATIGAAGMGGIGGALSGRRAPESTEPAPYEPPVSLTGATPEQMFRDQMAGRQGLGAELTAAARERETAAAEAAATAAEEKAAADEAAAAERASIQERAAGLFAGQGPQGAADLLTAARQRIDEQEQARAAEQVAQEAAAQKARDEAAQAILKTQLSPSPELNVIQQNKALEAMGYTVNVDADGNLIAVPKPRDLMMARAENEQKIVQGRRAEEMRTQMGGAEPNIDLLAAARERQAQIEEPATTETPKELAAKEEEAPPFIEATPIEGEPAPQLAEVLEYQKNLVNAEKERRRYTQGKAKGLSLWTALRGKLTPEEVNDIGPGLMFKSLQKKGGVGGADMSSLVADGKLDDFLPPRMRPMSEFHDEQEAVEYIKEKVRRQNYYTFDTNMAIQNLDNTVEELEKAIRELLTLEEVNLEIQKAVDEQAAIDREAEAAPAPSEARVTPERQGENAAPAAKVTTEAPKVEEKAPAAPVAKEIKPEEKVKPPELDTTGMKPSKGRHLQVQAAGKKFQEGTMSREEFEKYVDYYTPIKDVDIQKLQPPASDEKMFAALRGQENKAKLNTPIPAGTRVGLRMDLPARDAGANVVSIHTGAENISKKTKKALKDAGKVISYASVARIKDVFFAPRDQEKSLNMGIYPVKEPLQTAEGVWVPTTPEEAFAEVKRLGNDPAWTQVNFNPAQRGYFYDRVTGEPVVKASELIQVGNFILAKDVQYAPKSDFLYAEEKGVVGFNNTQENLDITKAIEGKSMVQVAKWAVDNAPNAFAKHFAQKALDRIKQMEARGVKFGFEVLTEASRPIRMRNARGAANFIWGKEDKGESSTINIVLNGPTVVKNQSGYPPGVEYRTILHELLHVATRGQLQFLASSDPLVKEIRSLFNKLIESYNSDVKNNRLSGITKDYYDRKNNAFADPDEMISWGLTDERMQKYMSGIEVGPVSIFNKLIDIVRRVVGISPMFESALDRLVRTSDQIMSEELDDLANGMKLQGYTFGTAKSKKTTGEQQSLFSKRVGELFANQEGVATADIDGVMAQLNRSVKAPDPSYLAKVRQSWDNATDNPKATAEAATTATTKFLDRVQTWAFSSDAALNNAIRRAIMDSTQAVKDKVGILLGASTSQTVHADALASLFITEGNLEYNDELHKWQAVKDDANFVELSREIDKIAEKYGKTKEEAEVIAHTAFEAKRLKSIVEFNNQIDREVAQMRAEASSIRKDKPVAASALSEKATKRLSDKKYIHKINGESELSAEDQIATGMSLFALMPELNSAVKTWNKIRQNTIDKLVESGLWSEEEAEFMLDNADYVPFFREEQLEEGKGPKEYIRGLMVQAKEKKLKGSDKPVNDIFDNMIRWTQYSINRAIRNKSALSLIDAATEVGLAKKVDSRSDGTNVIRVWRNGKEEFHDMVDPMFVEAFTGLEAIAIPSWKWAAKLSNMLRQSVVMYPLFSVSQVPQDAFAAMFSSGLKPQFALSIPARAVKEFALTLANRSKTQEELKKYGVVGVRDFTSAMVRMDAEIYAGFKARPGVMGKVKDALSHIAMASDNAVRQAVYEASIAQGLSRAEALEKAFEVWNVRRKGSSKTLALAGQVIPFFNAYLAAQNVAYKTITGVGSSPTERDAAFKTLIATTASVMALSLIYAMMNGDDDDYLDKPAAVRDRLLMIPGTGGLSIPLRADIFTVPKVITEHMYLLMTDKGYEDGRKFRDSMVNILGASLAAPTAVPQAIKPIVEVAINHNFFSGRPLIGEFEKKKETSRQFTDTTSELGKLFGSTGLISPIAADHLIRGMFGSAGGLAIYLTNPLLHTDPNVDRPTMSWREAAAALPGTSGFISREYESGLKNDFYVLRDEVSKVANTMEDLKARSPEKIDEYLSKEEIMERYGMAKGVAKMTEQLGKIRKTISRITNAPNSEMSADEKKAAIAEMRAIEKDMLKGINIKELRAQARL